MSRNRGGGYNEPMKIKTDDYRIREGDVIHLDKLPTRVKPLYDGADHYETLMRTHTERLSQLQETLYAARHYALLLVFQAMDAAGKDGTIKHVLSGINPEGVDVTSFKQPSATELSHDFLWRTYQKLPERGRIGVFNRSYYEEVLIVRVHPELLTAQNLPPEFIKDKEIWEDRFRSINTMEKHLVRNGTHVLKFFLHLSKDEQRRRFLGRLDTPAKNWKFSAADVTERKYWKQYQSAYEDCLRETSTKEAPWYAIPADDKENARLLVSQVVLETMEGLHQTFPQTDAAHKQELLSMRESLAG